MPDTRLKATFQFVSQDGWTPSNIKASIMIRNPMILHPNRSSIQQQYWGCITVAWDLSEVGRFSIFYHRRIIQRYISLTRTLFSILRLPYLKKYFVLFYYNNIATFRKTITKLFSIRHSYNSHLLHSISRIFNKNFEI